MWNLPAGIEDALPCASPLITAFTPSLVSVSDPVGSIRHRPNVSNPGRYIAQMHTNSYVGTRI